MSEKKPEPAEDDLKDGTLVVVGRGDRLVNQDDGQQVRHMKLPMNGEPAGTWVANAANAPEVVVVSSTPTGHVEMEISWRRQRARVDSGIAGLIRELWRLGARTSYSCQGGGVSAASGEHIEFDSERVAYIQFDDFASAQIFESGLYASSPEDLRAREKRRRAGDRIGAEFPIVNRYWSVSGYNGRLALNVSFSSGYIAALELRFRDLVKRASTKRVAAKSKRKPAASSRRKSSR